MTELLSESSIVGIYLIYGLAFFAMGLAVALETQRLSTNLPFARAMRPLAAFGLLHGVHEWMEMFIQESGFHNEIPLPVWFEGLRVTVLALSFASLMAFGFKLLYPNRYALKTELYIGGGMFTLWIISVLVMAVVIHPGDAMRLTVRSWLLMADTWSRYSLAIPAALVSSYALWQTANSLSAEQQRFANFIYLSSATFFIYGVVGQVFVTETYFYPSHLINTQLFEAVVGVPVPLFRAVLAIILAVTLIPTLNMFEVERQTKLAAAQQRAHDELTRREMLRREMFRHTVAAQEEERRRIARELHDEIGQTLTALSLGLQNVGQIAQTNQEKLPDSLYDLHVLTAKAVTELSNLVSDLRPSQLDHLGLRAALHSLMQDYRKRFNLKVAFTCTGERRRLPGEIELAVFRIAQESLTNIVRHSKVNLAKVELTFAPETISVCIADEGVGFTPGEAPQSERQHWGIMGMAERATQLEGTLDIESTPGTGTRVLAQLPLAMQSKRTENGRNN
jgi:signal transduction histidine kinase